VLSRPMVVLLGNGKEKPARREDKIASELLKTLQNYNPIHHKLLRHRLLCRVSRRLFMTLASTLRFTSPFCSNIEY
jgi:hypothetical protein